MIALTDHHTARNVDLIRRLGREAGLTVLAGIEFRTEYGSRSVHVIGLFPEKHGEYTLDSKNLQALVLDPLILSEVRIAAEERNRLKGEGIVNWYKGCSSAVHVVPCQWTDDLLSAAETNR